jgi:glyoxylase-like metal-dependent hydrolase (beta-lactamase superfamily II)
VLGGKVGIGNSVAEVQETFGKVFNEGTEFRRDGSQFDRLFADGDSYRIGTMTAFAMHTPGHTPACMTHVVGDAAFVGDTLFMPDSGTARADFQRTAQRITSPAKCRHLNADIAYPAARPRLPLPGRAGLCNGAFHRKNACRRRA